MDNTKHTLTTLWAASTAADKGFCGLSNEDFIVLSKHENAEKSMHRVQVMLAAQDMLDALKEVVRALADDDDRWGAYCAADDAIAKAEGRE